MPMKTTGNVNTKTGIKTGMKTPIVVIPLSRDWHNRPLYLRLEHNLGLITNGIILIFSNDRDNNHVKITLNWSATKSVVVGPALANHVDGSYG
jgi:hypothetical protein